MSLDDIKSGLDDLLAQKAALSNQQQLAGAGYKPSRDGQLFPSVAMTPAQAFYNYAMLPGWQKWKPTFRYGTINSISDAGLASVTLDASMVSTAQDLNINQSATLSGVDFDYMMCDEIAFESGDTVLIRFDNQEFENPVIVGFKDNPKGCGPFPAFEVFNSAGTFMGIVICAGGGFEPPYKFVPKGSLPWDTPTSPKGPLPEQRIWGGLEDVEPVGRAAASLVYKDFIPPGNSPYYDQVGFSRSVDVLGYEADGCLKGTDTQHNTQACVDIGYANSFEYDRLSAAGYDVALWTGVEDWGGERALSFSLEGDGTPETWGYYYYWEGDLVRPEGGRYPGSKPNRELNTDIVSHQTFKGGGDALRTTNFYMDHHNCVITEQPLPIFGVMGYCYQVEPGCKASDLRDELLSWLVANGPFSKLPDSETASINRTFVHFGDYDYTLTVEIVNPSIRPNGTSIYDEDRFAIAYTEYSKTETHRWWRYYDSLLAQISPMGCDKPTPAGETDLDIDEGYGDIIVCFDQDSHVVKENDSESNPVDRSFVKYFDNDGDIWALYYIRCDDAIYYTAARKNKSSKDDGPKENQPLFVTTKIDSQEPLPDVFDDEGNPLELYVTRFPGSSSTCFRLIR